MGDGKDWLDVEERGLEAKAVLCRGEGRIGGDGEFVHIRSFVYIRIGERYQVYWDAGVLPFRTMGWGLMRGWGGVLFRRPFYRDFTDKPCD